MELPVFSLLRQALIQTDLRLPQPLPPVDRASGSNPHKTLRGPSASGMAHD